jgi:hypothetical protein
MLLPYAGILPLPLLIASLKSSSLIFFTSSEAKSFTFIALPVAVSPLPSTPWHAALFCLYSAALFSSAFAGAQNITWQAAALNHPVVVRWQRYFKPLPVLGSQLPRSLAGRGRPRNNLGYSGQPRTFTHYRRRSDDCSGERKNDDQSKPITRVK